jgi:hypothetical protein
LWQAAEAYEKLEPKRYIALLVRAFRSTYDVPSPSCDDSPATCHEKAELQSHIFEEILFEDPALAEDLLPYAEPEVRRRDTELLVREYIQKKNLSHAHELLTALVGQKDFPYPAIGDLIQALPSERAGDRALIFSIAVTAFRANEPETAHMFVDDLGVVVVRFWRQLPTDAVLEAIDLMLDRAKSAIDANADIRATIRASKKSLSLNLYQYRLFELLPVLRELDPPRAESLLRDNQEASSALSQYSQGLSSFMPPLLDPSAKPSEDDAQFPEISIQTASSSTKSNSPDPAILTQSRQIADQTNAAIFKASSAPEEALRIAMTLPAIWKFTLDDEGYSPRARALGYLAKTSVKRNPALARRALDEANKIGELPAESAAQLVLINIEVHLALNESDRAQDFIPQGVKAAERLYDADTDPSDPSLGMKAEWVSTGYLGKLIALAAKISPQLPEQLIAEIRDPEIQAVEKVAFGNALAGTEDQFLLYKSIHKKSTSGMAFR